MKFHIKKRRSPIINIVSLIDVFTILLIFFIVTTTFRVAQPQLQINLPKSETANEAPAKDEIALLIVKSGQEISLDNKPYTLENLATALKSLHDTQPNRPLGLKIDKTVQFELIVQILDALKKAGIENIPAFTEATP